MIGRGFASAERPQHPHSHPERGPTRTMWKQSTLAHICAALAFVSYGFVLVRVVQSIEEPA